MAITIQLPAEIEDDLCLRYPTLEKNARDQFLVTRYHVGRFCTGDTAAVLGCQTRFQAEEWLPTPARTFLVD